MHVALKWEHQIHRLSPKLQMIQTVRVTVVPARSCRAQSRTGLQP